MKFFSLIVFISINLFSLSANASGFRCVDESGLHVKIYNFLHGEDGTRLPAVFVLSHPTRGTLLVAKGTQISKKNFASEVQYAVRGNALTQSKYVIVQIAFKEGKETIPKGEIVSGRLIFSNQGGAKTLSGLSCARYLKNF